MLVYAPNEKIRERLNSEFPNFPNDVPNNAEDLSSTVIRIAVEVFNEYLSTYSGPWSASNSSLK